MSASFQTDAVAAPRDGGLLADNGDSVKKKAPYGCLFLYVPKPFEQTYAAVPIPTLLTHCLAINHLLAAGPD